MKHMRILGHILLVLGLLVLIQLVGRSQDTPSTPLMNQATSEPFAVVELFTSQGCSSCPPADRVLSQLIRDAERNQKNILALSFHVDYWNYLGWRDPYSEAAYSARQELYGKALGVHLYTPQMVVNGQHAFVGSREWEANTRITDALKEKARVSIAIDANFKEYEIQVFYDISHRGKDELLNLALVEKGLKDPVKKGENRGRTLKHDNVVKAFEVIPLAELKGTTHVSLENIQDRKELALIAYVQDRKTMKILGAEQYPLGEE